MKFVETRASRQPRVYSGAPDGGEPSRSMERIHNEGVMDGQKE